MYNTKEKYLSYFITFNALNVSITVITPMKKKQTIELFHIFELIVFSFTVEN